MYSSLTSALTSSPPSLQLWQLFAGAKKRQVPGHYQALLLLLADGGGSGDGVGGLLEPAKLDPQSPYKISQKDENVMEKWTAQIEKVRGRAESEAEGALSITVSRGRQKVDQNSPRDEIPEQSWCQKQLNFCQQGSQMRTDFQEPPNGIFQT